MFLLLVIAVVGLLYYYFTRNFNYWAERNVKHEKPIPLFGTHFKNVFGYHSITNVSEMLYNKPAFRNEKIIGYYRGNTPELVIRDPDLIRQILNIDFIYFHHRGMSLWKDPSKEPLTLNLFSVDGDAWKLLRQRLTGAFTTSKLRSMFPLVVRCAEKLQTVAGGLAARGEEYDVRELMARFTTEFIGVCGFGIEMDAIDNDDSQFRKLGKLIFTPRLKNIFLDGLRDIIPEIAQHFYMGKKEVDTGMLEIYRGIRDQRNGKPCGRNDFIDMMLELKAKGKIVGESVEKHNPDGSPVQVDLELDDMLITAQLFIFFAAGFETSSSATSFTLHQLAYNPDIQTKIQEEIDRVLLKYDNKLCYDGIAEMSLLDMAFKESMRMFPSLGILNRVCTRKYTIPGLNVTVDPGVRIIIPVQAIQNDEKYFDNPTEFRPERFTPEAEKERHKYAYLPFGDGARACIGLRLGQMQSLAGLAALLQRFTFEMAPSTPSKLPVNPFSNVVQSIKSGIPLRIKERKSNSA